MKYFISFVEEYWKGQLPKIMCRIEIFEEPSKSPYAIEEIHFATDNEKAYYKFREKWDLETLSRKKLEIVRNIAINLKQEWLNEQCK